MNNNEIIRAIIRCNNNLRRWVIHRERYKSLRILVNSFPYFIVHPIKHCKRFDKYTCKIYRLSHNIGRWQNYKEAFEYLGGKIIEIK